MHKDIYNFEAATLQGENIGLNKYEGKVVLVVNTASKCGYTPQYDGLQKLYEKYNAHGLEILGFPCNQFGRQEPGGKKEIDGCLLNYGVTFQMFEKIKVNGKDAHPVFKYLKKSLPAWYGSRINWNFTKFLVGPDGKPVKRYSPATTPKKLEPEIRSMLSLS